MGELQKIFIHLVESYVLAGPENFESFGDVDGVHKLIVTRVCISIPSARICGYIFQRLEHTVRKQLRLPWSVFCKSGVVSAEGTTPRTVASEPQHCAWVEF